MNKALFCDIHLLTFVLKLSNGTQRNLTVHLGSRLASIRHIWQMKFDIIEALVFNRVLLLRHFHQYKAYVVSVCFLNVRTFCNEQKDGKAKLWNLSMILIMSLIMEQTQLDARNCCPSSTSVNIFNTCRFTECTSLKQTALEVIWSNKSFVMQIRSWDFGGCRRVKKEFNNLRAEFIFFTNLGLIFM